MSRRLQLTDSKKQLLTITMSEDLLNSCHGNWVPDAPGYVVASSDKAKRLSGKVAGHKLHEEESLHLFRAGGRAWQPRRRFPPGSPTRRT